MHNFLPKLKKKSQLAPYFVPAPDGVPLTLSITLTLLVVCTVACSHNDGVTNLNAWPILNVLNFSTANTNYYPLYESLTGTILCILSWFINLIHEGLDLGKHTLEMQKAFKVGFILFLLSEVMFFFAIFWSYLYFYINPSIWIGGVWPPIGIECLNYMQLPLANTLILLASGFAVNWAHRWITDGKRKLAIKSITITLMYGWLFAWLQFLEYGLADYSFNDSIYGSIFYFGTGFHGAHVLLGIFALSIAYLRIWNKEFTRQHHIGFWAAAIYWHFVDIVWIGLYTVFYFWCGTN